MAPATKSRNHELRTSGVMRYSRSTMNQKTGKYRKSLKRAKVEKPTKAPARMVVKDIGGDKNGKTRTVRVNRMVSDTVNIKEATRYGLELQTPVKL